MYRDELRCHLALLRRQALIREWYDRQILPGQRWEKQIDENLRDAHLVLLLVSAHFMNSDYCYGREMDFTLEQARLGQCTAIPIILSPVDWDSSPLGDLQALPKDAKPISVWDNTDEAWVDVVRGIRRVIPKLDQEHLLRKIKALSPRLSSENNLKVAKDIVDSSKKELLAELLPELEDRFKVITDSSTRFWIATAIGEVGNHKSVAILRRLSAENLDEYVSYGIDEALNRANSLLQSGIDNTAR